MKRWVLSRHDSQELIDRMKSALRLTLELPHSSQVECAEPADGVVFVTLEGKYTFVQKGEDFFPFLGSHETLALFPSAKVDEGAIKFLLNGADVMRPGVRSHDEWGEMGTTVVVREDKKDRGIAVARSLVKSGEMATLSKGPCLKNVHHLGDRYWNLYKEVS